jgi:hypothetical protein
LAFLLAPAAPVVIIILFMRIAHNASGGRLDSSAINLMLMVSYGCTLVFGLPAYLFLQRKKIYSLKGYLAVGGGIGALVSSINLMFLYAITEFPMLVVKNNFGIVYLGMAYGIILSLSFWVIAKKNRKPCNA